MNRKAKRARHKPLFIVEYDDAGFTHCHVLEEFDAAFRLARKLSSEHDTHTFIRYVRRSTVGLVVVPTGIGMSPAKWAWYNRVKEEGGP